MHVDDSHAVLKVRNPFFQLNKLIKLKLLRLISCCTLIYVASGPVLVIFWGVSADLPPFNTWVSTEVSTTHCRVVPLLLNVMLNCCVMSFKLERAAIAGSGNKVASYSIGT